MRFIIEVPRNPASSTERHLDMPSIVNYLDAQYTAVEVYATADHPASRYGQFVAIGDNGKCYGNLATCRIKKVIEPQKLAVGGLYKNYYGQTIICTDIIDGDSAVGVNPDYPDNSDIKMVFICDNEDLADGTALRLR